MIQPGLSRIAKLLENTHLPWRAIHVAGTNGKGSVCNYIASMLKIYNDTPLRKLTSHDKLRYGKFTSPHLIDRWDGITLNGKTISRKTFKQLETEVCNRNAEESINASEFEILTATAFKAFSKAEVDIGIVEVGMGGQHDATNIIGHPAVDHTLVRAQPLVTAISKIGLDHQAFLGDTLVEIATQKAGIMKRAVPVVYDESNLEDVKAVFDRCAAALDTVPISIKEFPFLEAHADWTFLPANEQPTHIECQPPSTHSHIQQNTSVALRSTWLALSQLGRLQCPLDITPLHVGITQDMIAEMCLVSESQTTPNHGRLERVELPVATSSGDVLLQLLLDGAHNAQSAAALADEVTVLRQVKDSGSRANVCWVVAASQGRSIEDLLTPLLRPGDSVCAVEFGPVDGMPWVQPTPARDIGSVAAKLVGDTTSITIHNKDVQSALVQALANSNGSWVVVAGSLYLVGDVHRLLKHKRLQLRDAVAARLSADVRPD